MNLTVLGSGCAISNVERAATGFALEANGNTTLIDLGWGCFKNLQKAGLQYEKIRNAFFTHFEHPDHVADLLALLTARKVLADQMHAAPTQLNLFGGKGFKQFAEALFKAFPFFQQLPFKLNVSELEPFATKKFSHFSLTTKQMRHKPSSLGYRFTAENKAIAFSGDTEPNEALVTLAKDADLLAAECSFAEREAGGHMNAAQAAGMAARANAKALLLHHFFPEAEKAGIKKIARKKFKGKIYLANDLMQVSV